MQSIFRFIANIYRKYRLRSFIAEIERYLSSTKIKQNSIELVIESLKKYRDYITEEQMEKIKSTYAEELMYLKSENMFDLNKSARSFYEKEKSWIIESPLYPKVLTKYNQTKDGFLNRLSYLDKYKEHINGQIVQNSHLINQFFSRLYTIKQDYITSSTIDKVIVDFSEPHTFFCNGNRSKKEEITRFIEQYSNFKSLAAYWNKEYVQRELKENKELFDDIDGKSLDSQQRLAIVTDEDHNLVLAGAGSGKTLTISGKVKYLIDKKSIRPEQILLISFTRKAADEMYNRISEKLNVDVKVKTFHKLGLEIISQHGRRKPHVTEGKELDQAINSYIQKEIFHDKKQTKRLIEFFSYYLNIPKDYTDFKNLGEYHEHCKSIDLQTIKGRTEEATFIKQATIDRKDEVKSLRGERVKSLEEVMIANFLFLNGVDYLYEADYKYETGDPYRRQYKPDFYLPEYDIYIEHFGITEDQRVPWLNRVEEEKYLDGIRWKRSLHQEKETTLLETYSYYNKQGVLLTMLKEKLEKHGVELYEIDFQEIFSIIFDQEKRDRYFGEFLKLIKTFIELFKSNGYREKEFDKFIEKNTSTEKNEFLKERTNLFLHLVKPIFLNYQDVLEKNKVIDFNDMINEATSIICSGEMYLDYRYIIIDEYQDISKSRFNLTQAIKEKTGAKVMCVGDDWQSIYRFAGSDIQLFTQFGNFFGNYELLRIEKTYRNSQELIDTAGDFVMKNPKQFKKNLTSPKSNSNPIKIIGFNKQIHDALKLAIEEIISSYGEDAEIMLLGRNNFDIDLVTKETDFTKRWDKKRDVLKLEYSKYPFLNLFFLTAHRSKGLEADNVILINAKNHISGFPNQITDDPILSWVLTDNDSFLHGEERRLFYVAMTRTKNNFYVLAPEMQMSTFAKELIENGAPFSPQNKESGVQDNPNCPRCQSGYLTLRTAENTDRGFVGCTNFPGCDYSLNRVEILNNPIKCSSCGGFLVKRSGKNGEFLGCSNYPFCSNSRNIQKEKVIGRV